MQPTSLDFKTKAASALADPHLQKALGGIKAGWQRGRIAAAGRLPEFEQLRDQSRDIKDHTLAHLDLYLEAFEARVLDAGGTVHWARDAAEAKSIIQCICEGVSAKTVTKSKSMVAEEIGLNEHLEAAGITPIETDLGEYIIQLRKEPPSHLVGPAVHLTQDQVADLFEQTHGLPHTNDPEELVGQARTILRQKYPSADVGITGANFLIAETGSVITVTNEGNAELTQGLPSVHVVIASLEKVIPSMEDAFTLLRVLARSATGQEFSTYTTVMTGPKRENDLDGPEQFHVVLLDNGRTKMIGTKYQDMLRCIRCGACMNNCPVYLASGGHAYGWVYVGPMGAVLTPQFVGIENAYPLPNASSFCGRCEEVCPVRIPLPNLMRHWREDQFQRQLVPSTVRFGLRTWGYFAKRPALYRLATRFTMGMLGRVGGSRGRFTSLPLAAGWTESRDMPAPQGQTFMDQWKRRFGAAH